MFSYWAKKTSNKRHNKNNNGSSGVVDQMINDEILETRPIPNDDMKETLSEERLLEFQEFLKRVQTLQMSPSQSQQQQQQEQMSPLVADIEVGVEPTTLMELDELNAVSTSLQSRVNNKSTTNIRVTVGIDKDLEMILEMDPSIVDLGDITLKETTDTRVFGLPPLAGG